MFYFLILKTRISDFPLLASRSPEVQSGFGIIRTLHPRNSSFSALVAQCTILVLFNK